MLDDYKIKGPKEKLEVEVEKPIAERLRAMATYMKLDPSELANTALKRFIASHKDFLPAQKK